MNDNILVARIKALEADIAQSDPIQRAALRAQLAQVVQKLEAHGDAPPDAYSGLPGNRSDDEIEALHDNLPV